MAAVMAIPCTRVLLVPRTLRRRRERRPGLLLHPMLVPHARTLLLERLLLLVWPLRILLASTRRPPCTACWSWPSVGRLRWWWQGGLLPGTAAGLMMVPLSWPPLPLARCTLLLLLLLLLLWAISIPLPPAPCS
jgi:hypothetical protein